jgi:hypothetical protein
MQHARGEGLGQCRSLGRRHARGENRLASLPQHANDFQQGLDRFSLRENHLGESASSLAVQVYLGLRCLAGYGSQAGFQKPPFPNLTLQEGLAKLFQVVTHTA